MKVIFLGDNTDFIFYPEGAFTQSDQSLIYLWVEATQTKDLEKRHACNAEAKSK